MAKAYSEIALIDVSRLDAAYSRGDLCKVMADTAVEYGPLYRWVASSPEEEGQMRLSMVGPEANRFVMNTHRQHFSHEIGWSPLINDAFGGGCLRWTTRNTQSTARCGTRPSRRPIWVLICLSCNR